VSVTRKHSEPVPMNEWDALVKALAEMDVRFVLRYGNLGRTQDEFRESDARLCLSVGDAHDKIRGHNLSDGSYCNEQARIYTLVRLKAMVAELER